MSFMGQESLSSTGQFIETSTGIPVVSMFSVVNHTPLLLMFSVLPVPVSAMRWP